MKTRVTLESLTEELDTIARGAVQDAQWAAAKGAVETKARLHGLLVERKETGAPGDFAALQSTEEIVAKVRSELGDTIAEVLLKTLAASQTVEPAERSADDVLQ